MLPSILLPRFSFNSDVPQKEHRYGGTAATLSRTLHVPDYRFHSVRPDSLVMHELGATSTSLAEFVLRVRELPDLTPAGGRAWRTTTMNFT